MILAWSTLVDHVGNLVSASFLQELLRKLSEHLEKVLTTQTTSVLAHFVFESDFQNQTKI